MKPRKTSHSRTPATTGEAAKAPATAGGGKLPKVSKANGPWNDALLGDIIQVAAGTDLRSDDKSAAVPRVQAAIEALVGIERGDVLASQLVASHADLCVGARGQRARHCNITVSKSSW